MVVVLFDTFLVHMGLFIGVTFEARYDKEGSKF